MKNDERAKVLSAESKPWKMEGREGVSHTVRLNILGEIFAVKTSEEQVNEFKQYVGKEGQRMTDAMKLPYTMDGFEVFCYNNYGCVEQYFKNKDGYYTEFVPICSHINSLPPFYFNKNTTKIIKISIFKKSFTIYKIRKSKLFNIFSIEFLI